MCIRCLYRAKSFKSEKQAMWRACPGAALRIRDILLGNGALFKPHKLVLFSCRGFPGLLCTSCGCHSSIIEQHLGFSCLGKPRKKGMQCLARFLKGLHPQAREGGKVIEDYWAIDENGGITGYGDGLS